MNAPSDTRQLISVIVPLKLEWEPVYYVPMGETVSEGQRVRVRFAGREYTAVVSNAKAEDGGIDEKRILEIQDIAKTLAPIAPEEIRLWREVADYYLCTVGEVYKAAYPLVKTSQEEVRAAIAERSFQREARITERLEKSAERLRCRIARKKESAGRARSEQRREIYLQEASSLEMELNSVEAQINFRSGTAAVEYGQGQNRGGSTACTPELTKAQTAALEDIKEAFASGKTALLDGVTGSGKTEIYIRLAAETLSTGKNVLYLVPEIALSRQLEDRLSTFFPDSLLLFHSGETTARKAAVCESIRDGKSGYIVLGTRSSIFLPHRNLGLVIVDEEQDVSYKQDSPAPRYNGRDSAALLARIHDADLLLGSATPSLESLYNCKTGRYTRIKLTERYHGSADAVTEIIDTKAERKKRGMRGNISLKLAAAIEECLDDGGQAIVLRARKSYSTFMQCSKCGEIVQCPHCNVSLGYSKLRGRMVCYHCGYTAPYTGLCSKENCRGELMTLGAGTERIEEELKAMFPGKKVERLDSDVSSASEQKRIIRDFANGGIDILTGTQIISKGFDFQNLNLVALIQADSVLGVSDFRADEKAMQLLEQFRGRCGRREKPGRFIIQTACPAHPVYESLSSESERETYESRLLNERKDFAYPPFSRAINITLKDREERRLERMASNLGLELRCEGAFDGETASRGFVGHIGQINISGPVAPAVAKTADEYIRTISVTMPKDRKTAQRKRALKKIVTTFCERNSYDGHVSIDVDPA